MILDYIREHAGNLKFTFSDIASKLQKSNPKIYITVQDVVNRWGKMKEARYDGLTATQVFLVELRKREQTEGLFLEIGREDDDDGFSRVNCIFWSYPWMIEMTKKHP